MAVKGKKTSRGKTSGKRADKPPASQCDSKPVVVIGAGPAGLAAAFGLSVKNNVKCVVIEKDSIAGGLSKTLEHNGFRFDIGPHRFFTKNKEVAALWQDIMGDDFLVCKRCTRIYYDNIFFSYPLRPLEIVFKLGLVKSVLVALSYIKRRLFPLVPEDSFSSWVRNRFGDRLYGIFFHDYTKKVWGVEPGNISADWAAQRIRALSFSKVVKDMLGLSGVDKQTSLVSCFNYPRLGAGQMCEAMASEIIKSGSEIIFGAEVVSIFVSDGRVCSVAFRQHDGQQISVDVEAVVSSMPLDDLVRALEPAKPEVTAAADSLSYRSLVAVTLMFDKPLLVADHWIYINSSDVKAGRMNLFHNWSESMAPEGSSSIELEYFCNDTDPMWTAPDSELKQSAMEDISKIDFLKNLTPSDFKVVRYHKSYPCYFGKYREAVSSIRAHLSTIVNLLPVGRYGQFRYNNMDHSVETGMLAAKAILGHKVDVWAVNEDAEYHEEVSDENAL
ncbi:MAG: FAD-dependent oxidoreductase [Victivallales bacterium]|nr:FAD-dependent oxidoreductase [Victivallales bacterium]